MKTLGIIGGLGPESTIDYYGRTIALYRERTRDDSYPPFLINSIDLNKVRGLVIANDRQRLTATIVEEIGKLARAGRCRGNDGVSEARTGIDRTLSQGRFLLPRRNSFGDIDVEILLHF